METVIKITTITRLVVEVAIIDRSPEKVVETAITRLLNKVTSVVRELIIRTKILQ